jgi:acetyl-CoA carboxylase carboxyltransferase component
LEGQERLRKLVDPGSFRDIEGKQEKNDGVYAGKARIDGIESYVVVQEPEYHAGTMGVRHIERIILAAKESKERKKPLVCIYSSGGARFQDGVKALYKVSELIHSLLLCRSETIYLSAVIGSCAGGASISASISDILLMTKDSSMFVYGPLVTKIEFKREVTKEELGGATIHAAKGTAAIVTETENECITKLRKLLLVLKGKRKGLEGESKVREIFFNSLGVNEFIELFCSMGKNVKAGISIYKNKPLGVLIVRGGETSGYIGYEDTLKILMMLELCSRKKINLIYLIDSPGFAPLPSEESRGLVNLTGRIAEIIHSRRYRSIGIINGKCYGGLFVLLCSKGFGCDELLATKDSTISVGPREVYKSVAGNKENFEKIFSADAAQEMGILNVVEDSSDILVYAEKIFK